MDMGIIANLKLNYKNYLSNDKNKCLEHDTHFSVNILDAMLNLKKSWDDVKPTMIQNCFKKAQFIKDSTPSNVDIIEIEKLQDELPTFEDDHLPICDMGTANGVLGESSSEDEIEERADNIRDISSATAMSHLQELSKFLLINKCDCMEVYNLKQNVYDAIDNSKKQTKITDFFQK